MREFSVFTAPLYSFFSRALFIAVGRQWGAKIFGYLLLVLAVSWLPFILRAHLAWSEFLNDEAPAVIQQIPSITIDNGRVTADVVQPHFIRSSDSDDALAIIDTTGQFTSLDGTSAILLLTGSQLIAKKSETETRVYDLSAIQQFYLDGARVEKWTRIFGTWGLILLYPVVVVGSCVYRVVQALFYSTFGLVIARGERCSLSYGGILRVTIVAITPAIALKTLIGMAGLSFPFAWFVYFLVAMGYLAFGLFSNRDSVLTESSVVPEESSV